MKIIEIFGKHSCHYQLLLFIFIQVNSGERDFGIRALGHSNKTARIFDVLKCHAGSLPCRAAENADFAVPFRFTDSVFSVNGFPYRDRRRGLIEFRKRRPVGRTVEQDFR